ncbi:metallophosphoesterase family protein [Lignipirellula cremea]|uniref:Calcineurin-like phosphoesterase superfamily domain protein n=1 Tax=Lignipirellula cremea TaxID=2528010 RepID=A0A518E281_9BACT|nr:metallophosphoesterase family protein [Lignipirellula cremea]QDU98197.1 Calcineurin-like phosphoesterase superfamily domain protein [Lignipirellula cremea]
MKLGLISDVHEQIEPLQFALERFRRDPVDQIVFLGDLFEMGEHLLQATQTLHQASVIGVWGNHDFGLTRLGLNDEVRSRFPAEALQYTQTLQPFLRIEDCHFSHVEPWRNPERLEDLWSYDRLPTEPASAARSFAATDARVIFLGHLHRFAAVSDQGPPLVWRGEAPLQLHAGQRYVVIIAAVCDALCAMYDTSTGWLTPIDLSRD